MTSLRSLRATLPDRRWVRRMIGAALAIVVVLGGVALPAATAEASALWIPPILYPGGVGSQKITFSNGADPLPGEKRVPYILTPQPDGTVLISLDAKNGACITAASLSNRIDGERVSHSTCRDWELAKFYIVPGWPDPARQAATDPDYQSFYLVSAYGGRCISVGEGSSLNIVNRGSGLPVLQTCGRNKWFVDVDKPNPDGVYPIWHWMLNQAITYASRQCADDPTACSVSVDSAPNSWYRPNDDSLANKGTLTTQNYGCGAPATIDGQSVSPRYTNLTQDNQTIQVGGQLSVSNSTQSTTTFGVTTTVEANVGVKDVWGGKFSQSFNYQNQQVSGKVSAQTQTNSVSSTVRPGESLMASWSGSVYSISGAWRFGEKVPSRFGSLQWSIPVSSSYPVSVAGQPVATVNTVTSTEPKNCDAVNASTIAAGTTPTITTATSTCDAPEATPQTVAAGTKLRACPGNWIVPAGTGSSTPDFHYQWYVFASDGDPGRDIPGATNSTYSVQRSTYNASTPFLGVRVWDAGNAGRLESRPPVNAAPAVSVKNPRPPASAAAAAVADSASVSASASASADAEPSEAVNIVGSLDDATTGAAYSAYLVAEPDSAVSITASGVPDGMTVTSEGVLQGAPTAPGSYEIAVVDTPPDGGEVQSQTIPLDVYDPPADFEADRVVEATADSAVSEPLVPDVPLGMDLAVTDGVLPPGMALDGQSGVLSGTPTAPGSYEFVIDDPESPHTHAEFTVDVQPQLPQFTGAVAGAVVGAAYVAPLVAVAGTQSFFVLTADSADLPDGLALDSATGTIDGTPTSAGTTDVKLVDVTHPEAVRSATITVAAAGSETPAAARTTLAATGADATREVLLTLLAASLIAAAAVLLILRRRSAR